MREIARGTLRLISFCKLGIPITKNRSHPLIGTTVCTRRFRKRAKLNRYMLPRTGSRTTSSGTILFVHSVLGTVPRNRRMMVVRATPVAGLTLLLGIFPRVGGGVEGVIFANNTTGNKGVAPTTRFGVCTSPRTTGVMFSSKVPLVVYKLSTALGYGLAEGRVVGLYRSNSPTTETYKSVTNCMLRGFSGCHYITDVRTTMPFVCLVRPRFFGARGILLSISYSSNTKQNTALYSFH